LLTWYITYFSLFTGVKTTSRHKSTVYRRPSFFPCIPSWNVWWRSTRHMILNCVIRRGERSLRPFLILAFCCCYNFAFLLRPVIFNCRLTNFVVSRTKVCTTGRTVCCRILFRLLFVCERKHMSLWFLRISQIIYFRSWRGRTIRTWGLARYKRVSLIRYNVGYAVARKTANSVLVDNPGPSIRVGLLVVVIVYWRQERFLVTDEIKWETELFLVGLKFEGTVSGSGYFTACGGLRTHSGVWRSRMALEEKGWRHPLHLYVACVCFVLPRTKRDMFFMHM